MLILRRRKLFAFAAFLGGGMVAARLLGLNLWAMLGSAGFLSALALVLHVRRVRGKAVGVAAALAFFLAVSCAGAGYYAARVEARPAFETAYGVTFSGRVSGSPYIDEDGARFVCTLREVEIEGKPVEYALRLYLRGGSALDAIRCGQAVSGTGNLYFPDAATNPHEFDFGEYLWRMGLAGYLTARETDAVVSGEGGGGSDALYRARRAISERIGRAFPKNADIVDALLLSDTRDMDDDLRADFARTGVAHLLAVSGLNITLIAVALTALLSVPLGMRAASYVSLAAIFAYSAIVGFQPSVARAVVMYAVLCGGPMFGRISDGSTRLAAAFALILIINPLSLADGGFVLSFASSAGLMWLGPPLTKLLRVDRIGRDKSVFHRIFYYFASLAVATFAAQIATFPAVALYYGSMPTYAMLANILLVPYTLLSMYASIVGAALPFLAFVPDAMLTGLKAVVAFFAQLPNGSVAVHAPPAWIWVAFLFAGVAVSDMGGMRERFKPYAALLLPALVVLSFFLAFDRGCAIAFLDVGQADAAVVRVEGRTYVVDVGEDGRAVADFVKGEGWKIDAVFLSHPHADHAGGLLELAEACEIPVVYVPEGWFEIARNEDILFESGAAADLGAQFVELSPGDTVMVSKRAAFELLDWGERTDDAINDRSLILLLDYGEAEALFTGDASVRTGPDIEVLKVGHHGAIDATDRALISALKPEVAVISVGENSYGHPGARVISMVEQAGGAVYRTDLCGAVTVRMGFDGTITVDTYLEVGGG